MTEMNRCEDEALNKFEHYKFARELISKEIELRRDKQWKIFSWTSGVFVAIIGGLGVISGKGLTTIPLPICHKTLLILSIVVLALYAFIWDIKNLEREKEARKMAMEYDKRQYDQELIKFGPNIGRGAANMIIALAFLAICTVVIS